MVAQDRPLPSTRTPLLSLLPVLLTGCGADVVLKGPDSRLSYSCDAFATQVESPEDYAVVRAHAARALGTLTRGEEGTIDVARMMDMASADAAGEQEVVERILVDHLCAGGALVPASEDASFPNPGSLAPEAGGYLLTEDYLTDGPREWIDLSDYRGDSFVFVNFWATWCLPCIEKHSLMVALSREYESKGFRVLGVIMNEPPQRAFDYMELEGHYPTVVDPDGIWARDFLVVGVPSIWILDPEGRIVRSNFGADPTGVRIRAQFDSLLAAQKERTSAR